MQYMGNKNKISKDIVPIIQSYIDNNNYEYYLEPFVGGANIIDKIKCKNKYGSDINIFLIELLKHIQLTIEDIPNCILEEHYKEVKLNKQKYPIWYQGLIGFCSFGNKFWNGYPRNSKEDISGERTKSYFNSIKKQHDSLQNIVFNCNSFLDINENITNFVIYCDPPYRNTTKYKTQQFQYEEFYSWCKKMSKNNIVIISEYNMPNDFECIWSKEVKCLLDSNKNSNDNKNNRTEKLFICKR